MCEFSNSDRHTSLVIVDRHENNNSQHIDRSISMESIEDFGEKISDDIVYTATVK